MPARVDYEYPVSSLPSRKTSAVLPAIGRVQHAHVQPLYIQPEQPTLFDKFVEAHEELEAYKYVLNVRTSGIISDYIHTGQDDLYSSTAFRYRYPLLQRPLALVPVSPSMLLRRRGNVLSRADV